MADNVTVDGVAIAADDISSVLHQRVKISVGADGSATDVSTAAPLPVSDAGGSLTVDGPVTDTQLRATAVPVSVATSADVATSLVDNRKVSTTVGTAVALLSSTACKWVAVTALPTNTALVWVGGSSVLGTVGSQKGTPLAARETFTLPVSNVSTVFLDVLVSGEGVTFTYGA